MSVGRPPGLLGRGRELEAVDQALERAAAGIGHMLLLSGEAGAGKTALAEEASERARRAGFVALWGSCSSRGDAPRWWPWRQILRGAQAHAPAGWPRRADRLAPLLATEAEAEPGDGGEVFALYDALRLELTELAAARPLLMVLDDLHAAAPATLELLHLLSHDLRDQPIVIIGSYRPLRAKRSAPVDRLLAAVARESAPLPLGSLTPGEVQELLLAAGWAADAEQAVEIHRATGGNPLLVSELALGEEMRRSPTGGALPLPDGLRAAARRWTEALPEAAAELLCTAALLGDEIDAPLLRTVAEEERGVVLDALGEALDAGLVVEVPDRPGRFRFRYPVVRQALVADLPAGRRADLHLRAAAAIEERYAADLDPHLDALAHHYAAGVPDDLTHAVQIAARAAARADELGDPPRAAQLWEEAVDLAQRGGVDRQQRCRLLLELGGAQRRAGRRRSARESFFEAARVATSSGDAVSLAHAALGAVEWTIPPSTDALDREVSRLLREALQAVGERDPVLRSRLLAALAVSLYALASTNMREELTAEALELAERTNDPAAQATAQLARLNALWRPGAPVEQRSSAARILVAARAAIDAELTLLGRVWRLLAHLELADAAAVDAELATLTRLAESSRDRSNRWRVRVLEGMRLLLDGRFAEAERTSSEALRLGSGQDGEPAMDLWTAHTVQLFACHHEQGNLPGAPESLRTALAAPDRPLLVRGLQALMLLEEGRTATARTFLELHAGAGFRDVPLDGAWLVTMSVFAELAAGLLDLDTAQAVHELLTPYRGQMVVAPEGAWCRAAVDHYLGQLEAVAGHHEEALRSYERALDLHGRLGARPAEVRSKLAIVASRRALEGLPEDSAHLLAEAHAAAVDLGMRKAAEEAERALKDGAALPLLPAAGAHLTRLRAALRRQGQRWTVVFEGRASQLRDAKGLRYLAILLSEPGVDHPAVTLERRGADTPVGGGASARKRFEELRRELARAQESADENEIDAVRERMEALAAELTGGGSGRRAEQARVNVTRAIKTALRSIAAADPQLAEHLDHAVRTGTSCSYRPDPRAPISWDVDLQGLAAS